MTTPDPQVKVVDGHIFYFNGSTWEPMPEPEPVATVQDKGPVNAAAILVIIVIVLGAVVGGIFLIDHQQSKSLCRDLFGYGDQYTTCMDNRSP